MSDAKNEIGFTVYMPVKKAKELTLYKNSKSYYDFSSTSYLHICLKADDYISVRSNTNTDNINITVQNDNNFSIDVIKKTEKEESVTYGIGTSSFVRQVDEKNHLEANSKKDITLRQSDKISVLKAEIKTNETEKKSAPENLSTQKTDIKPSKHEVEIKAIGLPYGQVGYLPIIPKILFRISADTGTNLKVAVLKSEVDGKLLYQIANIKFKNADSAKFSSNENKNTFETDGTVKIESISDDNYFRIESGGNVKIKNLNAFPIKITIKTDSNFSVLYLDSEKTTQLALSTKVSKVFVTKKQQLPEFENTTEKARFTLDVYGEQGVKLLKNGNSYFSFTKKGLSGVQIHLKDNDTIDIGPDEDFAVDPDLKVATQYTIASAEIRRKKRRLILRNTNDFFIIVIAEKDNKTYIISSFSQSFIFFGKDACKLYMLKGQQALTNRLPASQPNEIVIYLSCLTTRLPPKSTVTFHFKEAESDSHAEIPFKLNLKNKSEFLVSIDNEDSKDNQEVELTLIVASDPANQNILFKVNDESNTVIKPGGISYISIKLLTNTKKKCQVLNRLIQTIQIHETTDFRIPFKVIPYIRMSTSMQVDLLNTSIFDIQAELQKERKRKGEVGDCDVLTKMLYSTFFPFNDKSKVSAWAFAILFSNERGIDKVLITAMALTKKFGALGKYLVVEKLLTEFLSTVKSSDYYRSNVTDLMKKDFCTFLFELNISQNGFIVCMYRPAKTATLWEEPWRWFSELPTKINAGV
ncbi:hypothetical protein [Rickettsiella endosymbiont of Rhagonycha lignosa]|uniref:hypothetical protein n=1 Tax=Rickettsiella endosymbiont of Rhagonycha lignosa TaxID=3077937 RepID=UPI00313C39CC